VTQGKFGYNGHPINLLFTIDGLFPWEANSIERMKLPPPYVPPLSDGNELLFSGASIAMEKNPDTPPEQKKVDGEKGQTALAPSAPLPEVIARSGKSIEEPNRKSDNSHINQTLISKIRENFTAQWNRIKTRNSWIVLTMRERILAGIVLAILIWLPVGLPNNSVKADQRKFSDPTLQSVERAEENFAGSAFYFLDPNFAIPQNYSEFDVDSAGTDNDSGGDNNPNLVLPTQAIRPIAFRGSDLDNSRALQCLTMAIYYEAGLEPDPGQRAVAQVILNRVRHPSYPATVCGVVFQGSERRTGCQFTFTCDGSLRRKASQVHWLRSRDVARDALAGRLRTNVGTATHYHTTEIYPYWAPSLRFLGTIGAHRFYSWKGQAGKASAFKQRYTGGEPSASRRPRALAKTKVKALDPIAMEKAYEKARQGAEAKALDVQRKAESAAADTARRLGQDNVRPAGTQFPQFAPPNFSEAAKKRGGDKAFGGEKLPHVGGVKPEFRNSGTWKARPQG